MVKFIQMVKIEQYQNEHFKNLSNFLALKKDNKNNNEKNILLQLFCF